VRWGGELDQQERTCTGVVVVGSLYVNKQRTLAQPRTESRVHTERHNNPVRIGEMVRRSAAGVEEAAVADTPEKPEAPPPDTRSNNSFQAEDHASY